VDPALREVIMSGPFMGDRFGGRKNGMGDGWAGAAVWEAMEQLRGQFEQKTNTRMGRGDVRAAVLALLAEKPMHGYQVIQEIGERSGGAWKPSPESGGRKTYSLTDEGREVADAAGSTSAPWATQATHERGRAGALPKAGIDLAQAAAQVGRTGSPEQVAEAVSVLDDARRKLYSILAQG
jgi:DNA-binding PadR family transcriptional regulator